MKQILAIYAMSAAIALAQPRPVSGTITGMLAGEDETTLPGATVALRLVTKSLPKLGLQTTSWTAVTLTGGTFHFLGLPEGGYTLCPSVPNSTWLNPCDWGFPTPAATITRSAPTSSVDVTLKRGAAVPIRINDSGQHLGQNEGKTPGAGLLLEVSDSHPGSFFRLVPLVSQESNGRNYQIVIPFDTALTLFVHPTFYRVSDARGAPLREGATTMIRLLVARGQQVPPIVFTITGH
jgi:hypothetical protein